MTTHDGSGTTDAAAHWPPALLIVDADAQARAVTEAALARRFGADYRVLAADAPQAGLDALERLAERGDQVALLAADLQLPGMDGVEFLERAQLLHRDASRVLLVAMDRYHTRIPFSELATLQRATALGRVNGASEGLRTLVVEPWSIGGQAGSSSMIRNYLGVPRGISGSELAHRALGAGRAVRRRVRVHATGGRAAATRRPAAGRVERGRHGPCSMHRCRSRPACRGCSRPVTCATARSSAWPQPPGRARWPLARSTST
jgi:CheY-like chemotaxis protein